MCERVCCQDVSPDLILPCEIEGTSRCLVLPREFRWIRATPSYFYTLESQFSRVEQHVLVPCLMVRIGSLGAKIKAYFARQILDSLVKMVRWSQDGN